MIWVGTKEELEDFVKLANSLVPSIKVTTEFDYISRSVNYLDMTVYIDEEGFLKTDLYKKVERESQDLVSNAYVRPPGSCEHTVFTWIQATENLLRLGYPPNTVV